MLHQAFIFHLPSHITYFIGTCKQYNRPAIQYNTRFVSPFIYFLDNAYIYQLVHRHSTLTWHHFCQKIWGNLLFSSSFCLKVLIAGPRSSSGQPTHILPIWNVSNILFSCWDFLPSIQAVGLFWLGITTESTWFTCTPVVSKSAMGRQQFQTIYIYIFIELCIWLFNAFLVEIDQLPNLSHLSFL